jgi:hypothetical protein
MREPPMSKSARLEEHAERLRGRKKASLIYALFFLALLLVTSLVPALLATLAGYQPDPLMIFTWFFLSVGNAIQLSTQIGDRRGLEQTLELIDVLRETRAEDGGPD